MIIAQYKGLALLAVGCLMAGAAGCSSGGSADDDDGSLGAQGNPPYNGASPSNGSTNNGSAFAPDDAAQDPNYTPGGKYTPVGTNPFVLVQSDPLSTFAADVDTASYDLFRRDVNLGSLPLPASVRLEEYVNYFEYGYPAPGSEDAHPFRISLSAAPHLFASGTTLVRVGIQAKAQEEVAARPANLVFLVDTSGSMDVPNKLPLVKYTLRQALGVLAPTDKVSIVTYAGSTAVRLGPTPVSERTQIEKVIDGFDAGGSTAGGAAINLAYEQAAMGFIEGGINHILLCTDGDFNVGLTSNEELLNLIREKRATGVTFTALGYGADNLNDSMMEAVSNAGNGMYSVISDEDQATTYVHERLRSTIEHVAKDMKIQVEFNPEWVSAYRLLGYENRNIADDDFRNDIVDAGEVGAGHRVTALYELVPKGGTIPAPPGAPEPQGGEPYDGTREVSATDWVLVKVRYKHVNATDADPALEVVQSLKEADIAPAFEAADLDFQWALAIASYAEILKRSPFARREALQVIHNVARAQELRDGDRGEFLQLFERAHPFLSSDGT